MVRRPKNNTAKTEPRTTRKPRRQVTKETVKTSLSSRERGRQYRERLKLYQNELQQEVALLQKHVRGLQLLATLQKQLSACSQQTTRAVMKRVRDVIDGQDCETTGRGDGLRFVVDSCTVVASSSTPIVQLRGSRSGVLSHELIHHLYFCVPGTTSLLGAWLDLEVTFPSTRILTFSMDGTLLDDEDETEYVTALAAFTQNAWGWSEMLRVLRQPRLPHDGEAEAVAVHATHERDMSQICEHHARARDIEGLVTDKCRTNQST